MNLLLLTTYYPCSNEEPFIHSEVLALSKTFSRVDIFPTAPSVLKKPSFLDLPKNVFIRHDFLEELIRLSRLKASFLKLLNFNVFKIIITQWNKGGFKYWKTFIPSLHSSLLISKAIKNKSRKGEYQLGYSYWMNSSAFALVLLKEQINLPVICRGHGFDLFSELVELSTLPLQRETLKGLNRVFACSKTGENYLKQKYGSIADQVVAEYLGVRNQEQISSFSKDKNLHILSCSRLISLKRIDLIIEALSHVKRKVIWTHIGDGPLKVQMVKKAQKLPSNVEYKFLGQKTNDEVLKYYNENSVDLFVNVSESEGIPVSIMEAMSFGVPCCATNVGGNSEIVDKENGFLLPKDFLPKDLSIIFENFDWKNKKMRNAALEKQHSFFDSKKNFESFSKGLFELAEKVKKVHENCDS